MNRSVIASVLLVLTFLLFTPSFASDAVTPLAEQGIVLSPSPAVQAESESGKDVYAGELRIYVVEPTCYRYRDNANNPYEFGTLDIPFILGINVPDLGIYDSTFTWDASVANFDGVTAENIMAQAVVINPQVYTGYGNPPGGNPFDAYYMDAAAQAAPGTPGMNVVTPDHSHTIFVEEVTSGT